MIIFLLIVIIFILMLGPAALFELLGWAIKGVLYLLAFLFVLGMMAGISQNL